MDVLIIKLYRIEKNKHKFTFDKITMKLYNLYERCSLWSGYYGKVNRESKR